jgi:tol-pal system protein YbgF
VLLFAGCVTKRGIIMPWTREHEALSWKLDSLNARVEEFDSARQASDVNLRAALSNGLDDLKAQIAAQSAQQEDFNSRLWRITQRAYEPPNESVGNQATPPGNANSTALYDQAYAVYTRGKFEIARQGFSEFLKAFPGSDLAPNAQYWLAECFYSLGQFPAALAEFQKVGNQYPKSDKLTAASYKAGKCYEALSDRANAVSEYERLIRKYPNSPEARLAEESLKSLQH